MEEIDENKALKVLGLDNTASPGDIRRAFRRLAKQYHPDHWDQDPQRAPMAEGRMKEINRAWQFLKPRLSQGTVRPSTVGKKRHPVRSGKRESGEGLFRAFIRRVKKSRGAGAVHTPGPGRAAPRASRKRPVPRQTPFAQVLQPLCTDHGEMEKNDVGQGPTPLENYQRHMALKRQVNARKRASRQRESGPISPVSPVKKVGPLSR